MVLVLAFRLVLACSLLPVFVVIVHVRCVRVRVCAVAHVAAVRPLMTWWLALALAELLGLGLGC